MHTLDSPAALRAALRELAGNFWFTWLPGARALFEELGRERFAAVDHNPTALLSDLDDESLAAAMTPEYLVRVERALAELQAERERRTWWERRDEDTAFGVACFFPDVGRHQSHAHYSGISWVSTAAHYAHCHAA